MEHVTWGHDIVADEWAGATNPQPHPTLLLSRTHPQKQLQYHKCAFFVFSIKA